MMEAVARRKAHWLFGVASEKVFVGKRRPQEDMVTSAVFGSIWLMPPENRRKAIELVLGAECLQAAQFLTDHDIEIDFWRRLPLVGRRDVEPDVLLACGNKTLIVEVKWKSRLGEDQIKDQIEAAKEADLKVTAVMLLGHGEVGETESGPQRFHRTWRHVSGDLQKWTDETGTPLDRWVQTMHAFLQETDMGRVFDGLPHVQNPGRITFNFIKPGYRPWLNYPLRAVDPINHQLYEDKNA